MQESSARRPHPPLGTFLVVTTGRCAWHPVDGGCGRHSIPHGAWGGPRGRRDPASPVGGAGCRRCRSPTARPAAAPRVSFTEETPRRGGPSRSPRPKGPTVSVPTSPTSLPGFQPLAFCPIGDTGVLPPGWTLPLGPAAAALTPRPARPPLPGLQHSWLAVLDATAPGPGGASDHTA